MGKRSSATTRVNGSGDASSSKLKHSHSGSIPLSNGFTAIPLSLRDNVQHWVYVRKHTSSAAASTSKDDLPSDRTLFIANLPVDVTEDGVREWFGRTGGVVVSGVKFRQRSYSSGEEAEEDEVEVLGMGEEEEKAAEEEVKGKKGRKEKKSKVPRIVPLPALDPRVAAGSTAFLPTSSSAHVVFLDALSCTRALEALSKGLRFASSPSTPTGLDYLVSRHTLSRPPLPSIASWANSAIALYTYRRAHPLPRTLGVRGVTLGPSGELLDEDGFTIVQRSGGKYGRAAGGAEGGSVGIAKAGFVENEKKKSTGLEDFYRFQLREKKREQLAELRARFEEDKRKVERLKGGRRFKPY